MTVETTMGKITGTVDVLNDISLALRYAGDNLYINGQYASAERYATVAHEIYVELEKAGVYD